VGLKRGWPGPDGHAWLIPMTPGGAWARNG
jgi:hypothetical protein